MKDLIKIMLLFILVFGVIFIFEEELRKTEIIARTQTTAIPTTVHQSTSPTNRSSGGAVRNVENRSVRNRETTSAQPFSLNNEVGQRTVDFSGARGNFNFNSGSLVDGEGDNIDQIRDPSRIKVIHTISDSASRFRARAFLEEVEARYPASIYSGSVVFFDRTSGIRDGRPEREYFVLQVSNNLKGSINITDWKVFDRERRISYSIPKAAVIAGARDGLGNSEDLFVQAGDSIIVTSGGSPTGGSFLINKCSGYKTQFKQFVPSIKTSCPKPIDDLETFREVSVRDNKCYEFVDELRVCETVTKIPAGVTRQCVRFIENKITEKGCVEAHKNDSDFLTSEWRVFLDSDKELWDDEEGVLYLLDESGKLVSSFVYQ